MIVHVLRKPLSGTVAQNALAHGAGALNIDGCRIAVSSEERKTYDANMRALERYADGREKIGQFEGGWKADPSRVKNVGARWPANLVHDGSEHALDNFPEAGNGWKKNYGDEVYAVEGRHYSGGSFGGGGFLGGSTYTDSGSASRFFQQVIIK